jgi:hypothetical protein
MAGAQPITSLPRFAAGPIAPIQIRRRDHLPIDR